MVDLMDKINKKYILFFLPYIVSGIYTAWSLRGWIYPDIGNILLFCLLNFPLIIASIGLIFFYFNKKFRFFIWICAICWLVIGFSELCEENSLLPNGFIIITMIIISLLIIICLSKLRGRKT